jgi:cytochrome c-type biogenesis protein CcmH
LPLEVVLDDSMAMMPTMKLSAFDKVKLQARISASGNAQPEPGDLVGLLAEVDVTTTDTISLIIDTVMP